MHTLLKFLLRNRCNPADIIIINPTFGGWFDLPAFKAEHGKSGIKYIAMVCSVIDNNILKEYDENFAMCDDVDVIASKINHLLHTEPGASAKRKSSPAL